MTYKQTMWNSYEEKELAGKIYWMCELETHKKREFKGLADIAITLKLTFDHCEELYKKYKNYHFEPVIYTNTLYKSKKNYEKYAINFDISLRFNRRYSRKQTNRSVKKS